MRALTVLVVSALFLVSFVSAAFAQAVIEDDGDDGNTNIQYVNCSQVQQAFANQGQYGNANAAADDDSEAVAEISQDLDISQSQVNACLGSIGGGAGGGGNNTTPPDDDGDGGGDGDDGNGGGDDDGGGGGRDDDDNGGGRELAEGEDEVIDKTVLADELPETGGPSLLGAALGLALVAGGVSLIRFRR